jgi:hypothetical protein
MYSNKLKLKYLKLFLFSQKMKKRLQHLLDSNTRPPVQKSTWQDALLFELPGNVCICIILLISTFPVMVEKEVSHYEDGLFSLKGE